MKEKFIHFKGDKKFVQFTYNIKIQCNNEQLNQNMNKYMIYNKIENSKLILLKKLLWYSSYKLNLLLSQLYKKNTYMNATNTVKLKKKRIFFSSCRILQKLNLISIWLWSEISKTKLYNPVDHTQSISLTVKNNKCNLQCTYHFFSFTASHSESFNKILQQCTNL